MPQDYILERSLQRFWIVICADFTRCFSNALGAFRVGQVRFLGWHISLLAISAARPKRLYETGVLGVFRC
jgi:hypothetical protein